MIYVEPYGCEPDNIEHYHPPVLESEGEEEIRVFLVVSDAEQLRELHL